MKLPFGIVNMNSKWDENDSLKSMKLKFKFGGKRQKKYKLYNL